MMFIHNRRMEKSVNETVQAAIISKGRRSGGFWMVEDADVAQIATDNGFDNATALLDAINSTPAIP